MLKIQGIKMKKMRLTKTLFVTSTMLFATHSFADGFKRFSVSAGWLHVMPQGKANPFNINTAVDSSTKYNVGTISPTSFMNSIDPESVLPTGENTKETLDLVFKSLDANTLELLGITDSSGNISATTAGSTYINGIDRWTAAGTGLEADDVDTLGLMFNYYINDNVSLQLIGGLPPKVDIKGKGEIVAPMTGLASPGGLVAELFPDGLALKQDIPITNLGNKNKAASVRAWTPALEVQYQFGKSGVNKFRPYIGAGIMYSHFSNIKMNGQINADLVAAGHMIANILDGQAGAALDGKPSSASPFVRVRTTDAIAPIVSLGATYDITPNWYGVASVSYAKLNNRANIDVIDAKTGRQLIHSSTKVDIDPLITYVGVGYRF